MASLIHGMLLAILLLAGNSIRTAEAQSNGCVSDWIVSLNTNTAGGIVFVTSTNYTTCLAACLTYSGCTGIDWNPNNAVGQQCFFSGAWSTGRNNGTQPGVTHYDLVINNNCAGCSTAWVASPSSNVVAATANTALTIAACRQTCTQSSTCTGYDWYQTNQQGQQCYLSSGSSTVSTGSSPGVTHFAKVFIGSCATSVPSTTPGACFKSWTAYANTNTASGIANSATTVDDCKYQCLLYTGCTGIDWTPTNTPGLQCFLSGSWNTGRNDGGALGTTHYDLSSIGPNCPASGSTSMMMPTFVSRAIHTVLILPLFLVQMLF